MYGLPKIHKQSCPYRLIISNANYNFSPSYKLAKWLFKQLSKSLGKFSPAHVKQNVGIVSALKILFLVILNLYLLMLISRYLLMCP